MFTLKGKDLSILGKTLGWIMNGKIWVQTFAENQGLENINTF